MKIEISDFIHVLKEEFEIPQSVTFSSQTIIESVIEMSSINALIFLALIKTEYDVALTAGDLLHAKTVQELYDIVVSKAITE